MNAYVHASEKDNLVTCVRELKAGEHVFTLAVIQGSANHDAFALEPVK